MKTVIVGSGNIAAIFGEKIVSAGHELTQLVARRQEAAAPLASALGCPWTTRWTDIDPAAELYLFALSDAALEQLGESLSLPGKLVVHTAGALPVATLAGVSSRCGVIWPLQSLRAGTRPQQPIPLIVDAHRPEDLGPIGAFARSLSATVERAGNEARLKLHLAATLVNNFTNYLYTQAARYCDGEAIDFNLLLPLIRETADRLDRYRPARMQTGPAVRGDRSTMEKHLGQLYNYKDIKELYELFSIQIEAYYRHERIGKI